MLLQAQELQHTLLPDERVELAVAQALHAGQGGDAAAALQTELLQPQHRMEENHIKRHATQDALTGLFNRRHLNDMLLTALGRLLREQLRGSDQAFRYGGEAFCLLLPHTPAAAAAKVQRLLQLWQQPHFALDSGTPAVPWPSPSPTDSRANPGLTRGPGPGGARLAPW